jgi:hypothetical protein
MSYDKMRYDLREYLVKTLPGVFKEEKLTPYAQRGHYWDVEDDWERGRLWYRGPAKILSLIVLVMNASAVEIKKL